MFFRIGLMGLLLSSQVWAQAQSLPEEIVCENSEYPKGYGSKLVVVQRSQEINLYLRTLNNENLHAASYRALKTDSTIIDFAWYGGMDSSDYTGTEFSYQVVLKWFGYLWNRTILLGVKTDEFDEAGNAQDVTTYYQYKCQ